MLDIDQHCLTGRSVNRYLQHLAETVTKTFIFSNMGGETSTSVSTQWERISELTIGDG